MKQEEILEIFKKTNSILKGHFILTSGKHSDTYMQCAKLFTDAEASETLCKELAKKVDFKVDIVASPAVGGILMGYEVSRALKVPNIFAERVNGQFEFRRGFGVEEGQKVLVVEDVVTTGGSVKELIALLKEKGAEIVGVASIVDRSNGKVDFGVKFFNLLSIEVLSYDKEDCPLCKENKIPAIKPGSRSI